MEAMKLDEARSLQGCIEGATNVEAIRRCGERRGVLPRGSQERKDIPLARGVVDYFPAALAEVAKVSKAGNDKHNPGQPMHHARDKSTDHADSIMRHLMERGGVDPDTGVRHSAEMAWRALALLQQELEDAGLAPLARGARLPASDPFVPGTTMRRSEFERKHNQTSRLLTGESSPFIEVD